MSLGIGRFSTLCKVFHKADYAKYGIMKKVQREAARNGRADAARARIALSIIDLSRHWGKQAGRYSSGISTFDMRQS